MSDLNIEALRQACREHGVKALYAFGSVVSGGFTAASDLDFIVEFDRTSADGAFDQFMTFKETLERLFGRQVDLLTERKFRNPLFQAEVERSKKLLYAA